MGKHFVKQVIDKKDTSLDITWIIPRYPNNYFSAAMLYAAIRASFQRLDPLLNNFIHTTTNSINIVVKMRFVDELSYCKFITHMEDNYPEFFGYRRV